MGSIYINGSTPGYPSIADVIAGAGLELHLWPGWEWNTRSSGGFDKLLGIVAHHTASPPTMSFDNDWAYCAQGHPDSPVANVLLGRQGQVGLHSGGASNHAGKSEQPWVCSKGTVGVSAGNSNLIGIEAANNGTGEPWGAAMLDAYERLVAALCSAYGFDPTRDVPSHALAGPGYTNRKIDPWGPAAAGDFPYTGSRTWVMQGPGSFTEAVQRRMSGQLPEDDVTDEDIQKIAAAVWSAMIHNYVNGSELPAVSMLGYAHSEAYEGSFQRENFNLINQEKQPYGDLLRYAHAEAFGAHADTQEILELLRGQESAGR